MNEMNNIMSIGEGGGGVICIFMLAAVCMNCPIFYTVAQVQYFQASVFP